VARREGTDLQVAADDAMGGFPSERFEIHGLKGLGQSGTSKYGAELRINFSERSCNR
jgi:hypothetical protein